MPRSSVASGSQYGPQSTRGGAGGAWGAGTGDDGDDDEVAEVVVVVVDWAGERSRRMLICSRAVKRETQGQSGAAGSEEDEDDDDEEEDLKVQHGNFFPVADADVDADAEDPARACCRCCCGRMHARAMAPASSSRSATEALSEDALLREFTPEFAFPGFRNPSGVVALWMRDTIARTSVRAMAASGDTLPEFKSGFFKIPGTL
jgi:hypothetical protein